MSLLQSISDFIQSLFFSNRPEVKARMVVKKLETELRQMVPQLYKGGLVQPNFAEAIRVLFVNTKDINDLLSQTLWSEDLDRNRHYEEQLLVTGFTPETQQLLESLSYDQRKAGAMEAPSLNRYFEAEHKKLERVVKELNTQDFVKIDFVLDKIKQLNDICKFNYISTLRLFDSHFSTAPDYEPDFQALPPEMLETVLMDMYYVMADMDISNSMFNAFLALMKIRNRGEVTERQIAGIKDNLRKIQGIIKHLFTKDVLKTLIRITKKDPEFLPASAVYKGNARQKYANLLESRFRVDESRLKTEIQDETIKSEVNKLFEDMPQASVHGYTSELNSQLKHSTQCSFMWILPIQVLKSFILNFYEKHLKPLLNDIVIEGFFNNPVYKSDFSTIVFACNESLERIEQFESMFNRGNEFDEANITGLIHDSHKDIGFENTLKDLVDRINRQAKEVIQTEVNNINALQKKLVDIIVESKKPSSEVITNLKVLMISSRNRENSEFFESKFDLWQVFLEIMKNYVIIGNIEKK